jgi:tRNA A-37 threonylcarbamoyl transferase component Bud32
MNPIVSGHPGPEQLAAFRLGKVSPEELTEIERHLASCPACCASLKGLPDDSLIVLMRRPLPAWTPQPDAGDRTCVTETHPAPADERPAELEGHTRYQVLALIGSGGMGTVYKAEHRLMERLVALKVIHPSLVEKPGLLERFRREVKAAARLSHPNVAVSHDAEQAGNLHFLVMEFIEGTTLAQVVAQQGPLPVALACNYIRQAALGLEHAHRQGMVHRDVKPHNLMLVRPPAPAREDEGVIKVLDFGLARFASEVVAAPGDALRFEPGQPSADTSPNASLTTAGVVLGTADYIAPEQADDPHAADIRADIYSLGCTLYFLLTGQPPFPEGKIMEKLKAHRKQQPHPLAAFRKDVPPGLERVLGKMIAKDPAQRFQTPAQVAEALGPFLGDPKKRPRRAWWLPSRRITVVACAILAALALVMLGASIYVKTDKGEIILETQGDDIAVMLDQQGVKIRDRTTGREYLLKPGQHNIRTGEYDLIVSELPAGVEFSAPDFKLKRDGQVKVTARYRPRKSWHDSLDWFPADATLFGFRDLKVFPGLSDQQVLLLSELVEGNGPKGMIWKFRSLLGRIDRISFAYAADRKQPGKSRIFIRIIGEINHQRLVDWLRQDFPGAVVTEQGSREQPVTLIGSTQNQAPAFLLVGSTDVVLAGYQDVREPHLRLVEEVLALRAGRKENLPTASAALLKELPPNPGFFVMGEPPDALKEILVRKLGLFPALPRTVRGVMTGTKDMEVHFRAVMQNREDARAFIRSFVVLKQMVKGFLETAPRLFEVKLAVVEEVIGTLDRIQLKLADEIVTGEAQIPAETLAMIEETLKALPVTFLRDLVKPPGGAVPPP